MIQDKTQQGLMKITSNKVLAFSLCGIQGGVIFAKVHSRVNSLLAWLITFKYLNTYFVGLPLHSCPGKCNPLSWIGLCLLQHIWGFDRRALETQHPNPGKDQPNQSRANAAAGEGHNSLWWASNPAWSVAASSACASWPCWRTVVGHSVTTQVCT